MALREDEMKHAVTIKNRDDSKDLIRQGDLIGPREFFESINAVRIHLYTIEAECDAYASDQATKALAIIDEAFDRLK